MRKKIRPILVDGREYAWAVEETIWPARVLRVWQKKAEVWFEKDLGTTNPVASIMPKHVAAEIRIRLLRGRT